MVCSLDWKRLLIGATRVSTTRAGVQLLWQTALVMRARTPNRSVVAAGFTALLMACGASQTQGTAPDTDDGHQTPPPTVDVFPTGDDAPTPKADEGPVAPGFLQSELFYAGGGFDPHTSWELFEEHVQPQLSECYAQQLNRDPRAGGLLVLEVRGDQSGAIREVVAHGAGDKALLACIEPTLKALRHPKPSPGGSPMARWMVHLYPTAQEAPPLPKPGPRERVTEAPDGSCVGVTRYKCPRGKKCRAPVKRRVACP